MATIDATKPDRGPTAHSVEWNTFTSSDEYGEAVEFPRAGDKCVHVTGVFGSGGTIQLWGSNKAAPGLANDDDWVVLDDTFDAALTFTQKGLKAVNANPIWVRPKRSGGDGTTDLDVILSIRSNK